jgi:hypothetical protein
LEQHDGVEVIGHDDVFIKKCGWELGRQFVLPALDHFPDVAQLRRRGRFAQSAEHARAIPCDNRYEVRASRCVVE